MKKIRIYNNDEINILLKNNNVEKVMNKSKIVYKKVPNGTFFVSFCTLMSYYILRNKLYCVSEED